MLADSRERNEHAPGREQRRVVRAIMPLRSASIKSLKGYYDKGGCYARAHVMWVVVSLGRCVASQRNWSRFILVGRTRGRLVIFLIMVEDRRLSMTGRAVCRRAGGWLLRVKFKQEENYES